jgi:benzoylformate decarboxylase
VVGAGVVRCGAFEETVALAERLGAPVWQDPIPTLTSFPQRHPLFAGHLPPAQKGLAGKLSGHDVVLVLGAPVFLYYPYAPGPALEGDARLYQITDDPEEASRAAVGTSVVGDVRAALRSLLDLLPEAGRSMPAAPDGPPVPEATTPISVEYAMHALSEALPDESVVFDESISSKSKLHKHVRLDSPGAYHTAASGGLGFAMPASVGFKLGSPELPVICVIGDGSSMYSIQALWTAARYGANVVFFVINNRGYSILKGFRDAIGAEEVPGLDVPDVDLVSVARGLGVEAERVEKAEGLSAALERALDSGRPYLLDVIVDPEVPELLS